MGMSAPNPEGGAMSLKTAMLAFVTSFAVLALFNFGTLAADNHAHHMDEQMPASGAADTHADHVDEQMPASGAADTHADHMDGQMPMSGKHMGGHGHWADPAGIAGANMPAGTFMLDYRPMFMHMEGNRIGTDGVSPEFIVTTVPNPNGGPPTLRVVPKEMDVQMHETALTLLGANAELVEGAPGAVDAGAWMKGYQFALAGPIYAGPNAIQRNVVAERNGLG